MQGERAEGIEAGVEVERSTPIDTASRLRRDRAARQSGVEATRRVRVRGAAAAEIEFSTPVKRRVECRRGRDRSPAPIAAPAKTSDEPVGAVLDIVERGRHRRRRDGRRCVRRTPAAGRRRGVRRRR